MTLWIVILLCLIFSAFFSGLEIAFVTASKLKIELDNKQGSISGWILSRFLNQQSRFIGTMLVGNNIALVVYGWAMAMLLEPPIENMLGSNTNTFNILLLQTLVSTLLILVTAEFLPKTLFRANPNGLLKFFAVPLLLVFYVLWLPMIITIFLSKVVLRIFGIDVPEEKPVFGRIDLDDYLKEATERTDEQEDLDHEIQIFQNALDFSKLKVRECLIPRTEIVAIDVETPVESIRDMFINTGLSKLMVFRDNIDNIIGYVHHSELFKHPESIAAILLPIDIVPESMPANDLLGQFIRKRRSVAVVVDEFGGTSGMVTIEDVVEEIFGEIEDEHDKDTLLEEQLDEHNFDFSARLEIDYLNENYKLGLPDADEYETLAGFIISHHESIPELNEQIAIPPYYFRIIEVDDNRIQKVRLTVAPTEA